MLLLEGDALHPEKRKGRDILTRRVPHYEALLKGLVFDADNINAARRTCKNLWAWRNEFDVRRRTGGMFAPEGVRITKAKADKLLFAMLAELADKIGGGE